MRKVQISTIIYALKSTEVSEMKRLGWLWIPLVGALLFCSLSTWLVKSPATTYLSVVDVTSGTPFSSVAPGEYFTVDVRIDTDKALFTFQFYLQWNASLLECTNVTEGDFLNEGGAIATQFTPKIYNSTGYIYVLNGRLGTYTPGRSGAGTLATVTFLVEKEGGCAIDLYDPEPPSEPTLLLEITPTGPRAIPHVKLDGYFLYPAPSFNVDPQFVVDSTLTSGSSFSVDVNITDVTDLYGFEFKLNYDTTVLTASDIEFVPFLNEPTYEAESINDTSGYVMVNVTSQPPAVGRSGSGVVASVTFSVEAEGSSDLSFSDTNLIDSAGVSLLHSAPTGSFSNEKVVSEITMSLSRQTIEVGESVTISGLLSPSRVGVTVTIKHRVAGSTTWDTLATTTTDSSSQYTHTWTPTKAGSYEIQAVWLGDATTTADQSSVYSLEVDAPSTNVMLYVGIGVVVVVVIVAIVVYFLKFRKPRSA